MWLLWTCPFQKQSVWLLWMEAHKKLFPVASSWAWAMAFTIIIARALLPLVQKEGTWNEGYNVLWTGKFLWLSYSLQKICTSVKIYKKQVLENTEHTSYFHGALLWIFIVFEKYVSLQKKTQMFREDINFHYCLLDDYGKAEWNFLVPILLHLH
ncbi:hypothetical protein TURU_042276 [Turdus rufiventris]|nr:hypothetical protein TURU_042276 [Turdus rufiventris]